MPRSDLLARLLLASAVSVACGSSGNTSTGERTESTGGAAQGGQAGTGPAGASGQGVGGGGAGCSGQAPVCKLVCSDETPSAMCIKGEWACPAESGGPKCQPGAGGSAGAGPVGVGGSAGTEAAGAGGGSAAGGAGGWPECFPPGMDFCAPPRCYPKKTPDEVCLDPTSPGLAALLGCTDTEIYSSGSLDACCYEPFCGEGRPLVIDGERTRAALLRGEGAAEGWA